MPTDPLRAQIDAARVAIEALVPASAAAVGETVGRFVSGPGELHIEDEASAIDRQLDVMTTDSGGGDLIEQWGTAYVRRREKLLIGVRYDARADMNACDQRMLEDANQIASCVEAPAHRADGVVIVTYSGRRIDRASKTFPILWLEFAVIYQAPLAP